MAAKRSGSRKAAHSHVPELRRSDKSNHRRSAPWRAKRSGSRQAAHPQPPQIRRSDKSNHP